MTMENKSCSLTYMKGSNFVAESGFVNKSMSGRQVLININQIVLSRTREMYDL